MIFCLAADDKWRAGLVNQDGVNFVHDRIVQATLHAVCCLVDHIVTKIVKAVLVIRTIGNIRQIRSLLLFSWHLRQINPHRQPKKVVELAHPLCIPAGQVVVDGHDVDALAGECIQIHRQSSCQCLALSGSHLGNFAVV